MWPFRKKNRDAMDVLRRYLNKMIARVRRLEEALAAAQVEAARMEERAKAAERWLEQSGEQRAPSAAAWMYNRARIEEQLADKSGEEEKSEAERDSFLERMDEIHGAGLSVEELAKRGTQFIEEDNSGEG